MNHLELTSSVSTSSMSQTIPSKFMQLAMMGYDGYDDLQSWPRLSMDLDSFRGTQQAIPNTD